MLEKILASLVMLGIAIVGVNTWKRTRTILEIYRKLPDEGKQEMEEKNHLFKYNGKPMNLVMWISALIGVLLFVWILMTEIITG